MALDIGEQHSKACGGNVVIKYEGEMYADLITRVLEEAEKILIEQESLSKLRKRVYNVLVEALQNLYHHALENPFKTGKKSENSRYAMFALKKNGNYCFTSGNYVKSDMVSVIKAKLDDINSQTLEELKLTYKKILTNNKYSSKGGGGLGFIDIARRARSKYEYSFTKANEHYYFFSLGIIIANI